MEGQKQPPGVPYERGVFENFAKFTGEHLCQGLLFNKVARFIKKQALAQLFSCGFCEIFKNTFFTEHLLDTASASGCFCKKPLKFWLLLVKWCHKLNVDQLCTNVFFVEIEQVFPLCAAKSIIIIIIPIICLLYPNKEREN